MSQARLFPALAALLLTAATLPLPPFRRAALSLLTLTLRLGLPTAVLVCGLFAVFPDLVPAGLTDGAGKLAATARLPLAAGSPTVLWLGLGVLLVAAGLPLLAHLEYARQAAGLHALLDGLHRHAAAAADALRLAGEPPARDFRAQLHHPEGDVAAGVAVLRAVLNDSNHKSPAAARPPLVKDLLFAQDR